MAAAEPDILERILARKREELEASRAAVPLAEMQRRALAAPQPRDFVAALRAKIAARRPAVIAEVKKASPSRGLLRADFDPAVIARGYEAGGAACLSVLTDRDFFKGDPAHLAAAKGACSLPVLRKDFVTEPYQVFESRAMGADCILLIAAILARQDMQGLEASARSLGMAVLVEVHDADELGRALSIDSDLIGINNRNLKTLAVDLAVSEHLAPKVPKNRVVVAESGLASPADLARMAGVGASAFLIGESFMRKPDVEAAVRDILRKAA
jgi:indole-3-glycerol phosphate synthase